MQSVRIRRVSFSDAKSIIIQHARKHVYINAIRGKFLLKRPEFSLPYLPEEFPRLLSLSKCRQWPRHG
jgi:hypothetical protein